MANTKENPKTRQEIQKKADEKRKDSRGRNWWAVLYPEDLPDDWRDRVQSIRCKALISPLHDKDMNADGSPKKDHHHVVLMFDSIKSLAQVDGIFRKLFHARDVDPENLEVSIPGVAKFTAEKSLIHDRAGAVRYLCHLDNPEKEPYNIEDIEALNGADVMELLKYTQAETQATMIAMEEYIEAHGITTVSAFSRAIRYSHPDWYNILSTKSTTYFRSFINGFWRELNPQQQQPQGDVLSRMGRPYPDELGNMTGNSVPARPDQHDQEQQIAQKEGEDE